MTTAEQIRALRQGKILKFPTRSVMAFMRRVQALESEITLTFIIEGATATVELWKQEKDSRTSADVGEHRI